MRYGLSMLLAFLSGIFQVATAARLAADATTVTEWLLISLMGLSVFWLFGTMAYVSVIEERKAVQCASSRA